MEIGPGIGLDGGALGGALGGAVGGVLAGAVGGAVAGAVAFGVVRRGRYRREGDSPRLPLSRSWLLMVAGALVGALLGARLDGWELAAALVFLAAGLAVTWTDIDVYRVPTGTGRLLLAALTVPVGAWAVADGGWALVLTALAGALLFGVGFFVVSLLTPLGMGDVRLAVPAGLLLGAGGVARLWPGVLAIVVAGGVIAVALLAGGRFSRRDPMPYAPAIVAGTLAAVCL